jgi:hypothetical protein
MDTATNTSSFLARPVFATLTIAKNVFRAFFVCKLPSWLEGINSIELHICTRQTRKDEV